MGAEDPVAAEPPFVADDSVEELDPEPHPIAAKKSGSRKTRELFFMKVIPNPKTIITKWVIDMGKKERRLDAISVIQLRREHFFPAYDGPGKHCGQRRVIHQASDIVTNIQHDTAETTDTFLRARLVVRR